SSVKGFATMLIINIFVTIVVMVFVVRYILEMFVKTGFFDKRLTAFVGVKKGDVPNLKEKEKPTKLNPYKKLDFMKYRKWHILPSAIILIFGVICIITGGLNLGIDYRGGTDITVTGAEKINVSDIKEDIKDFKVTADEIDNIDSKTVYIKLNEVLEKDETEELETFFSDKYNADVEIGVISNIVKKELTVNAIFAVILSLVGMVIYVSFRFRFTFAIASMVALVHDVLIILAVFAIFKIEIASIFIAAILTIIGYSINDTIVIFDRIREVIKIKYKNIIPSAKVLGDIVNESLRGTFTRTLFTTITVMFPIISLIFLGAYEINNFNIAIFIGLIAGVYSTVFLSPQLWQYLELKNIGKQAEKKTKYKDKVEELTVKGINS
ncbi:MAG: protein translocase subunit SecF, partial [Bacilli bacterium]|nr:protein translocase subunit SecF [Bacilli bacterium]